MQLHQDQIVIRFAGDSGDGIQAIGREFADHAISFGNQIYTIMDFPAEIRAPTGTVRGISKFQLCFATQKTLTAGDELDLLVVFNPAALQDSIADLKLGGILIADLTKFIDYDLVKAGYTTNPLATGELNNYRVIAVPISSLTQNAVAEFGLSRSQALKCKNIFALGIIYYLYDRSLAHTSNWINTKFKDPNIVAANLKALEAGYAYANNTELFKEQYLVLASPDANNAKRKYITGNIAMVYACLHMAQTAPYGLFAAGYPITPASEILQELTKYPDLNVITLQAEDEIAAISAAIGAAFGGSIAITCTSGPGFDLKQEAIGLAVMTELPLVIINVQRAGPSTGMPTKMAQTDLTTAMYGRHGEAPLVILAPQSPADCFNIIIEAIKIATRYMVPVIVLSDANLANVAESWQVPDLAALAAVDLNFYSDPTNFQVYKRDPLTLARPWVIPGTPNLTYRIGGLEKKQLSGEISYDPDNHAAMLQLRALKVAQVATEFPKTIIAGKVDAAILLISWGSTYGVATAAINELNLLGYSIAHIHLRYLNPLPLDLSEILANYSTHLCVEANLGQLTHILRAKFLYDVQLISKTTGQQFLIKELKATLLKYFKVETVL